MRERFTPITAQLSNFLKKQEALDFAPYWIRLRHHGGTIASYSKRKRSFGLAGNRVAMKSTGRGRSPIAKNANGPWRIRLSVAPNLPRRRSWSLADLRNGAPCYRL